MRYKNIVTGEIVDEQILICDYNDDELNGWKLVE